MTYAYNRLGEAVSMTDQLQTEHAYIRDLLGRVTEDQVTLAAGSPVDDAVLRIEYAYEARGPLEIVTSTSGLRFRWWRPILSRESR